MRRAGKGNIPGKFQTGPKNRRGAYQIFLIARICPSPGLAGVAEGGRLQARLLRRARAHRALSYRDEGAGYYRDGIGVSTYGGARGEGI